MGGGREAMADYAHGVNDGKNRKAPICQKRDKKEK
jgi:hypothetical protein